jgi:hypothetical protein
MTTTTDNNKTFLSHLLNESRLLLGEAKQYLDEAKKLSKQIDLLPPATEDGARERAKLTSTTNNTSNNKKSENTTTTSIPTSTATATSSNPDSTSNTKSSSFSNKRSNSSRRNFNGIKQPQPCEQYELNLSGKEFGECICGWAKTSHKEFSLKKAPSQTTNNSTSDLIVDFPSSATTTTTTTNKQSKINTSENSINDSTSTTINNNTTTTTTNETEILPPLPPKSTSNTSFNDDVDNVATTTTTAKTPGNPFAEPPPTANDDNSYNNEEQQDDQQHDDQDPDNNNNNNEGEETSSNRNLVPSSPTKHQQQQQEIDPNSFIHLEDVMLVAPKKRSLFSKPQHRRVELRKDEILWYDKNNKILGKISITVADFLVIPSLYTKKSPTGYCLHFSPADITFYPDKKTTAEVWAESIEMNLSLIFGKPDLGVMDEPTHYQILNVKEDVDSETLRLAYMERSRSASTIQDRDKINFAYQILHDAVVRMEYDNSELVRNHLRNGLEITASEIVNGFASPKTRSVMFVNSTCTIFYYQDIKWGHELTAHIKSFKLYRVLDVKFFNSSDLILEFKDGDTITLTFDSGTNRDRFTDALKYFKKMSTATAQGSGRRLSVWEQR